ncbi:MAG: transporter substrate-binding domain-containing protein [Clostridia bacterium]|nr:transporter substrate-binding domain-containing protein [Clostridia bacterium]
MKKLLVLALAVLMAVSLFAGCSSSSEKLLIGTSPDYEPFEYLDAEGKVIGFDMDLMAEVAKLMDVEYEIKEYDFSIIISTLQSDQIDIGLSGFTWSEEREGKVLFTTPYYNSAQVAVVLADSTISSVADLEGKTIMAGEGTTGMAAAKEIAGTKVTSPDDYPMAFEFLKGGQCDAVVCDLGVAQSYAQKDEFKMLNEYLNEAEEMSMIVNIKNEDLLKKLNAAIEEFMATDAYDALLEKWGLK